MEPFRYHVFVCDQKKPEGAPCCSARGSARVIEALRAEVAKQGLASEVQITACGSIGLCERGPNMIVYPEGTWYSGVTPGDVPEIVRKHLAKGVIVERLANRDAAALRAEINENKRKYLAALQAKDEAGLLPDDLTEAIRAFQPSRVLLTAIELDIFTAIGAGAAAAEVAAKISADPRATGMLLNALVALDMLTKRDGIFQNSPISARYFTAGSRDDARAAMMHTVHLWPRWSTLTDCVRAGASVSSRETHGDDWTSAFIAAMHHHAAGRASHIVDAVGAAGVRRMLDVGGGSGAYPIAFARANPDLHSDILDLPAVVQIAQKHIDAAGLAARVHPRVGDLRADAFGKDYDLVFISSICHMLGEEENRALLRKSYQALAPAGRVVIQDFILDPDKTSPRHAALFSLNMLTGTRNGASYSVDEYSQWLREAGFSNVERVRLPGPSGLMIGRR